MKPKIKQMWVKALRSGKYKKGRDALRTGGDKFCCLGVLCDLAVKQKVIPKPRYDEDADNRGYVYDGQSCTLSANVRDWAGLSDRSPTLEVEKRNVSLIELNDGEVQGYSHITFRGIANLIEKHL